MIELLKSEIESYDRYQNNQIFYIDENGKDFSVKDSFSYSQWLKKIIEYSTIKVEGLENNHFITSNFLRFKINSIHLFYKNKKGFSFNWHKDDTNVYLYVIGGRKKVFIEDNIYWVGNGDGVHIKKGQKHKVESDDQTWALSIGYD